MVQIEWTVQIVKIKLIAMNKLSLVFVNLILGAHTCVCMRVCVCVCVCLHACVCACVCSIYFIRFLIFFSDLGWAKLESSLSPIFLLGEMRYTKVFHYYCYY